MNPKINKQKIPVLLIIDGCCLVIVFWLITGPYPSFGSHSFFNAQGIIALQERNLLITATLLMFIIVIPVFVLLFTFLWKYRASNTEAQYSPELDRSTAAEIVWWSIPLLLVSILGIITWKSSHTLDPAKPLVSNVPQITIQVVALDWKWLFIYPEQHIATVNFVEFPANTPINFQITADAPMNSFFIPQLGGQMYAMPGMSTQLHLEAFAPGSYHGLSANISGAGFSSMNFIAKSVSASDYTNWVTAIQRSSQILDAQSYANLVKPSSNAPVSYYASTDPNLYTTIVMKYMSDTTNMAPMNIGSSMEMNGNAAETNN